MSSVPETPSRLSNTDFRALLDTPRSDDGREFSFKFASKKRGGEADSSQGSFKQPAKPKKSRPQPKAQDESSLAFKYRDRARERREGVNPDYEGMEHLEIMNAIAASEDQSVGNGGGLFQNHLAMDKTKYLGGDVEHTHLVKGLDTVLLSKVRAEQVKESEKSHRTHEADHEKRKTVQFTTGIGRSLYLAIMDKNLPKSTDVFLLGRTTYIMDVEEASLTLHDIPRTLCKSKEDCPSVEEKVNAQVNPALMSEIAKIVSYTQQGVKSSKKGKKKAEVKTEPATAAVKKVQVKQEDEDERIFSDAEDYVPDEERKVTGAVKAGPYFDKPTIAEPVASDDSEFINRIRQMVKAKGSFGDHEGEEDMQVEHVEPTNGVSQEMEYTVARPPPAMGDPYGQIDPYAVPRPSVAAMGYPEVAYLPPPPPPPPVPVGVAGVAAPRQASGAQPGSMIDQMGQRSEAISKAKDKRERDPAFVSDSYAECYPGAFEPMSFQNLDYDSEEDDVSKMDLGKQGKKMKRSDFETEEEWTDYNYSREAMPKAAFQFGVKLADGRKTKKIKDDSGKASKEKDKDKDKNKIDRDLNRINQMMQKWKEDGGVGKMRVRDLEDE